jgi:CheY-like chemotaxis protein
MSEAQIAPTIGSPASALGGLQQRESTAAQRTGIRVLVVEDDEADAWLLRQVLKNDPRIGEVVHTRDGVEALEALEDGSFRPDLAIVDLQMPKKNGFSLLLELAVRDKAAFPIVVLTSSRHGADAVRARMRGAERFITKPNSLEKLAEVLKPVFAEL